jgi:hypothetical protein
MNCRIENVSAVRPASFLQALDEGIAAGLPFGIVRSQVLTRTPMRRIRCCAHALGGQLIAAPPSSVMNSRRFNGNVSGASNRKIPLRET